MSDNGAPVGPVDVVLLEFDEPPGPGSAEAMMRLVDSGVIRVYDILAVHKSRDGTVSGFEVTDLQPDSVGGFALFAGGRSGLLGEDDIIEAGGVMESDTTAVLVVYENTWADDWVSAIHADGGQMVASAMIPTQDIVDVLDELERQG